MKLRYPQYSKVKVSTRVCHDIFLQCCSGFKRLFCGLPIGSLCFPKGAIRFSGNSILWPTFMTWWTAVTETTPCFAILWKCWPISPSYDSQRNVSSFSTFSTFRSFCYWAKQDNTKYELHYGFGWNVLKSILLTKHVLKNQKKYWGTDELKKVLNLNAWETTWG